MQMDFRFKFNFHFSRETNEHQVKWEKEEVINSDLL